MEAFNTSLIREKIIFVEGLSAEDGMDLREPEVVRSNRILLRMGTPGAAENIVVRAQNMHSTLRLAGRLLSAYMQEGPLSGRGAPFDWKGQWEGSLSAYEKQHNRSLWAAVYLNGVPVFRTLNSPLIDVVEKCALQSIDNYDASMTVAEGAFRQIGRAVRINHSSSVAATFTDSPQSLRCGILHRVAAIGSSIFSFTGTGGERFERIIRSVEVAAAYLEALNLRFLAGRIQERVRAGEIGKTAPEVAGMQSAAARQAALSKEISAFEEAYGVQYRPQRPDLLIEA